LFVLGLVTAVVVLPYQFGSAASEKGLSKGTSSQEPDLPNYDIRTDQKSEAVQNYFAATRGSLNQNAAVVADIRENFVRGEDALRTRLPHVKFEYNEDIRIPEVITPDVWQSKIEYLSSSSETKRSEILRNFLKENNQLVGISDQQANDLRVTADYTNPDGYMSFAHLEQDINGIPVFRGEVKAGFTKDGRIIRVINNLAPGLNYESLSTDFGDPTNALKIAAGFINSDIRNVEIQPNKATSTDSKVRFGDGDFADQADKIYFPTEPGVAVPAWRILIWQARNAFYVIVDAHSGTMLWRKNLTEDQTQSVTYNVYRNSNAFVDVADSPFPLSPGPIDPTLGTQGTAVSRTAMALIGNEVPNTFNNLGWITDGNNTTDGNNVQAGLDRKLPNAQSPVNPSDIDPDGMATGNPNRVFNFPFVPGNPNTNAGDNPLPGGAPGTCLAQADATLPSDYQKAAVTQLFYIVNRYHDAMYRLGFTEPAFNFQNDNFARGGTANDRVSAQAQDCSGTDNANFTTPADGTRGSMQMYIWTGPTPDFDGDLDAEVIIHEHTHGLSNRLHGNSSGLSTNMSRGMGEGWGDFFGYTMLSEPTDPINGVYTTGGYATYLITAGFTANYYYGIRRFPRAPITFLGPNGKPHNPFTFQYVNSNCNTLIGTTSSGPNSAFPRGPVGSSTCDQVHNLGEVWSSALWEVRNRFVARLGWATGTPRVLQAVTDGMKLAPAGPTFLQERDAIILAATAFPISPQAVADAADVRDGFRARGMGFSASIQNAGTGANNTAVTEAFDTPNAIIANPVTFTDPGPGGNGNGFADPGETILFSVPVTNSTGSTMTNVTVSANGGTPVSYGSVANGATVTQTIPFSISPAQLCGSNVAIAFVLNSDAGTQVPFNKSILIGQPILGFSENFDGVTPPALPAGWTTAVTGTGVAPTTSTTNSSSAPNNAFVPEQGTTGTNEMVTPAIPIASAAAQLSFKNLFNLENTFDGMVLEISNPAVNGGAFQDIITAGGSFASGGYRTGIVQSGTCVDPLDGRQAWTGLSAGTSAAPTYIDTLVNLPASANGQSIRLKFLVGSDCSITGTTTPGARVDSITITTGITCAPAIAVKSRGDFDGDGKTDFSVFRPSEGNWYMQQSQAGFGVVHWGANGDIITPGDFDGDGKTDWAVFRGNVDSSQPDFFILNSNGFTVSGVSWGLPGDTPIIADYDGDGKADIAVYRPSTNEFFILKSGGGTIVKSYGIAGDVPVAGDFIGDNKADITIFRPSTNQWWIFNGSGDTVVPFGSAGDILVPADYNNDNKDDLAVFRPSTGQWIYQPSGGGAAVFTSWGSLTDIPVPGDYDGDGKDDFAIYRNGQWWVLRSTSGPIVFNFGVASDKAVPRAYIP